MRTKEEVLTKRSALNMVLSDARKELRGAETDEEELRINLKIVEIIGQLSFVDWLLDTE